MFSKQTTSAGSEGQKTPSVQHHLVPSAKRLWSMKGFERISFDQSTKVNELIQVFIFTQVDKKSPFWRDFCQNLEGRPPCDTILMVIQFSNRLLFHLYAVLKLVHHVRTPHNFTSFTCASHTRLVDITLDSCWPTKEFPEEKILDGQLGQCRQHPFLFNSQMDWLE